jgi:ABC-2 type transport system ATP-binding protein
VIGIALGSRGADGGRRTAAGDVTALRHAAAARALTVSRGGRTVLDELSFTIARGQVTGLLGPSGCGKTTLMRRGRPGGVAVRARA